MIYDATNCLLGEGPLWHPERGELLWFDILARRLMSTNGNYDFPGFVTAAGWIDRSRLLMATTGALVDVNIDTGAVAQVARLGPDNPGIRPNDGRADAQGGFWIGTMGVNAEPGVGAIWRFYKGEVRRLFDEVSIPNSICFAPDGRTAYFTDTPLQQIMKVGLGADGWPQGTPSVHVDLTGTDYRPDGSVVAADGSLWNAQWGAGRVAVYAPDGREVASHEFPADQTTCPAFGGAQMSTLHVTSASAGLSQSHLAQFPDSGRTFALETRTVGQKEHRVLLGD